VRTTRVHLVRHDYCPRNANGSLSVDSHTDENDSGTISIGMAFNLVAAT
jgi:hypothetical protein